MTGLVGSPAALVDLDGTLVDSRADLVAAVQALLRERGLRPLPDDVVVGHVGRGARNLVARCLEAAGAGGDDVPESSVLRWMALYGERCLVHTRPYPGARDALARLRSAGYRTALVTNKPESLTRRILAGLDLMDAFDVVLGGDTLPVKKPSGEPLRHALVRLGADPARSVMIGDSEVDVLAARDAGVRAIGCTFGIGDPDRLRDARPDVLAANWSDVEAALRDQAGTGPVRYLRGGC